VHVVDKATKLETIYDRIHLLDTRFEVLKREAEIELLKEKALLMAHGALRAKHDAADATHRERIRRYDDDRAFLRACNIGGEGDARVGHRAREGHRALTAGPTPPATRRTS